MTRIPVLPARGTWRDARTRLLRVLALVGVAVAVGGITGSAAGATMLRQMSTDQTERTFGRATTVSVDTWPRDDSSDQSELEAVFADMASRDEVVEASRVRSTWPVVRFPDGDALVTVHAVDVAYASIHALDVTAGRWLAPDDADQRTAALVASESFMTRLGAVDVSTGPTVLVGDDTPVRATVVGVVADTWVGASPEAFILYGSVSPAGDDLASPASGPTMRLRVPGEDADDLVADVADELAHAAPDWEFVVIDSREVEDSALPGRVVLVLGVSVLVLALSTAALTLAPPAVEPRGAAEARGATEARARQPRPVPSRATTRLLVASVARTAAAGAFGIGVAVVVTTWAPEGVGLGADVVGMAVLPPFPGWTAVLGATCAILAGVAAGLRGAGAMARAAGGETRSS